MTPVYLPRFLMTSVMDLRNVNALGEIRTHTLWLLRPLSLPLDYESNISARIGLRSIL